MSSQSISAKPSHKMRRVARDLPPVVATQADSPTPERLRDPATTLVVERGPDGWPVTHYRVGDIVARLRQSGLIESDWAAAGNRFRKDYTAAQYAGLGAADLRRPRGAGGQERVRDHVEDARDRLWRALMQLGGTSSPTGSVAWHVLGGEMSLQQWVLRQNWGSGRAIRHEMATGVLIAALGALAGHYAGRQRQELRRTAREPHA